MKGVKHFKKDGTEHKGKTHTYIITNHHVIADNINVEKKWNPVLKKKIDT